VTWRESSTTTPTTQSSSPRPASSGGKEGVREGFIQLLADVPNADWTVPTQIYEGDVLFIERTATSAAIKVEDGIDTFVFRDGMIRVQTVRYTLQPIR